MEVGVDGDRVEGHEPEDDLLHLAGRTQQADVGTAVGDDGEIGRDPSAGWPARRPSACGAIPSRRSRSSSRRELADELVESVARLSDAIRPGPSPASSGGVGVALLDEGGPLFVGHAGDVQLVGEALFEPVAALDVDRVDPVQRLLGPSQDGRAFGGDVGGDLVGGVDELVPAGRRRSTDP